MSQVATYPTEVPSQGPSTDARIREGLLDQDQALPLLLDAEKAGTNLREWAAAHRQEIETKLLDHGGILFRGFELSGVEEFEQFIAALSGEALEYKERSSPRSQVSGNIYTSTDYPPDQPIFLHNENSYQHTWPQKIAFYSVIAAETGGETPIADVRKIYQQLPDGVREPFERLGWMYVRNFGDGFGLPWETVFQTEDRQAVEDYCRANGIEPAWKDDGRLRTRAVRPAVTDHPVTGEKVWFNHATFFHVTTLEEGIREMLLEEFEEEDLPTNTFYGDGSRIDEEALQVLRQAYADNTVMFPWQVGDVLLLDNMLVAHGRSPFTGDRKVVVGMAEPRSRD